MQFHIGDKVKVMLPADQIGTDTVKEFQGKVSVVEAVRYYRKGSSMLGRSYILLGCKSDWGIDYEFTEDWLVPLDDEEVAG